MDKIRNVLLMLLYCGLALPVFADEAPSFNRDIRPILAAKCFVCHGPDEENREAELRLDVREEAVKSGAFVPGKPNESELVKRIFSMDSDLKMPPGDATLSKKEKQQLRRWVEAGAKYEKHWAFVKPQRVAVPSTTSKWIRNEIDHFVLAGMTARGLQPSPEADRYRAGATLVSRLDWSASNAGRSRRLRHRQRPACL